MATAGAPPSHLEYKGLSFLIIGCPSDATLPGYLEIFRKHHVTDIARACQATYNTKILEDAGIAIHDVPFADGATPPDDVIAKWKAVVAGAAKKKGCIAVHCVSGLGRAPVLVGHALISHGMDPTEAVQQIRGKRKGALNRSQVDYLQNDVHGDGCCTIM